MMKRLIFAVAIAAVAAFMSAGTSSADVTRYQSQSGTLTATVTSGVNTYVHTFAITVNPCDNSFSGVGNQAEMKSNIIGTINGSAISFTAVYPDFGPNYQWSSVNGAGSDSIGQTFTVTTDTTALTTSSFKNHGEYVSSMGGGADAAHSCIGMPVGSQAGVG
jgi:hypothetical protein